jgi:hypothetical protein
MSYLGRGLDKISNIEVLDNITFDGSSSYSITKSSVAFTPNSAQSLLISIDGVVQATNFTISSSTINFGVAVPSTSTCDFFLHYGTGVAFTPADGTVTEAKIGSGAVTSAKLSYPLTTFSSTGIDDNATSTAITIDSSENVGIGISNPSSYDGGGNKLVLGSTSGRSGLTIVSSNSTAGGIYFADGTTGTEPYRGFLDYDHSNDSMRFFTNGATERMRINSSGDVSIGTTSAGGKLEIEYTGSTQVGFVCDDTTTDANTKAIQFKKNGTEVGTIKLTTSSTSYNTSSDYRLKENVSYDFDATTRLKQLKPARFNFITDANTTVDGFIAHEVQDIVPEAISGEKDAMRTEEYEVTPAVLDEDGNVITEAVMGTREVPDYQGIDQSKLVPLLVKTIQELEARLTALENA